LLNTVLGSFSTGVEASTSSYESIASATGTGSSGTISFTSIPSTYSHLQIRGIAYDAAGIGYTVKIQFNGDTGSNYAYHVLLGTGAVAAAGVSSTPTESIAIINNTGTITNALPATIVDVIDYANTSKYKTARIFDGYEKNASGGNIEFRSGLWMSTSAINRVDIKMDGNFATNTTFALYGIKG
jgi:hypothetical protein